MVCNGRMNSVNVSYGVATPRARSLLTTRSGGTVLDFFLSPLVASRREYSVQQLNLTCSALLSNNLLSQGYLMRHVRSDVYLRAIARKIV